jgi:hypothetical protein
MKYAGSDVASHLSNLVQHLGLEMTGSDIIPNELAAPRRQVA